MILKTQILGRNGRELEYQYSDPMNTFRILWLQNQFMVVCKKSQRGCYQRWWFDNTFKQKVFVEVKCSRTESHRKPRYNFKQWITLTFPFVPAPRSMDESFNLSDDSSGPNPGIVRKKKIAIGVIFSLSRDEDENNKFNEFFFSHFPLFESHMNKLKSAIEQVNTVPLASCTCACSPSTVRLISNSCC